MEVDHEQQEDKDLKEGPRDEEETYDYEIRMYQNEVFDYEIYLHLVLHAFVAYEIFAALDSEVEEDESLGDKRVISRFYQLGFSPLLSFRASTQAKPPIGYTSFDLDLHESEPRVTAVNDKEESSEPPKKLTKTASAAKSKASSAALISFNMPSSLTKAFSIHGVLDALKEIVLPTTSIIGYITTLFGGVLHMSYPPTYDELELYLHVVYLHRRIRTPGAEVEKTLSHVLSSLQRYPSFGFISDFEVLTLIKIIWTAATKITRCWNS